MGMRQKKLTMTQNSRCQKCEKVDDSGGGGDNTDDEGESEVANAVVKVRLTLKKETWRRQK